MPRRVLRRATRELSEDDLPQFFAEYLKAEEMAQIASKRAGEMKETLRRFLESEGYEDEKGSKWVDLPETVGGFNHLKNERRVSSTPNEDRIRAWLKRQGRLDEFIIQVPTLDVDAVLGMAFEEDIPERTVEGWYEESESWAFKKVK